MLNTVVGEKGIWDKYALEFNGSDEYLDCGTTFQNTMRNDDGFTISMWIRPHDGQPSSVQSIFGVKADSNNRADIQIGTSGQSILDFEANGDDQELTSVSSGWSNGTLNGWTHYCMTSNSDSNASSQVTRWHRNGSLVHSMTLNGVTQANRQNWTSVIPFFLGARNDEGDADQFFDGEIAEFAVYDRYIISGDLWTFYEDGNMHNHLTGPYKDNLVCWWRMGDGDENGTGTTIYDMSGNGNHATMVGMDSSNFNYMEGRPNL